MYFPRSFPSGVSSSPSSSQGAMPQMVLPTASKCEENRRRLSNPSCGILARKVPFARLVTTGSAILVNVLTQISRSFTPLFLLFAWVIHTDNKSNVLINILLIGMFL